MLDQFVIDISDVSWQREEKHILRHIHWQVKKGEHWCLVGQNGSGKTSLLNLICGYTWPTKGQVSVLGHRYGEVDLRDMRKSIGWVSSSLMSQLHENETAERVVLSGREATIGLYTKPSAEDIDRADALLEEFGCGHLRHSPFRTLSQGERQKVLIARALMASPRLLILDEPCTGLDLLAREQLLSMIARVAEQPDGPTLLYVTHHIEEILPCFTHTLLLKAGQVVRAGQSLDVLTKEVLSGFFGVPLELREVSGRVWVSLGEASPAR
ncbi:ABC transporter ATP-binding protein [Brevibacillus borstelensis]|uniref:ABC transporter ATP-binding protein n=1 Tax=Brevibacillus borstelensis TaxID=45462 RepID=UPI002040A85E|nr:ABC transporter ATP-binding protein [Brevibacillus borstelensis]MCM3590718.1 ABC transporter ATP-binding protein [Brevibacillus borstelensis]WNF03949.1 ABC transporter ATP-binding protein [Brevibacillus borstelensis]